MQDAKLVRNVALFGHGKCGKTSLAEALLFSAGITKRHGKVDEGTSVLDYEPEEIARKLTISSSFHNYSWKKHSVYLIDTPGDDNFLNDTSFAARIVDTAVFLVGAAVGVKFQTERIAGYVADNHLPTIIFVTKMDRERANFDKAMAGIRASLPFNAAVTMLPIGAEADFKGVIDLMTMKAYLFDPSGKASEAAIPADMVDQAEAAREALMEQVAETDDELIEKFLEEGALTDADLRQGLISATKKGTLNPVLVGAGIANKGTEFLMNAINEWLPAPVELPAVVGTDPKTGDAIERQRTENAPFSGLVFKTISDPYAGRLTVFKIYSGILKADSFFNVTKQVSERFSQLLTLEGKDQKQISEAVPGMIVALAKLKETTTGDTLATEKDQIIYAPPVPFAPVMSYAVAPKKKDDEDKLFSSINKMMEEDPTLRLERNPQTKQTQISGVGQIHLMIIGEKIKRKFGVEIEFNRPKVPYLETIKSKATAQGRHKKQSGGRGQYGDSWIDIEPLPRGGGFEFVDRIVGGVIPRQYIPAVEKGIVEAMENGFLAGFPLVDIRVGLFDGSFHNVDSSEMAFKISGSLALKNALPKANPVLLEPVMEMTIRIPKDCVGDVLGDLNSRRGKVMGMDSEPKCEVIIAQAPMEEVLEYAVDLTSITGGRGTFTMKMSHYEELPAHLADKVVAAHKAA